MTEEKTIQPQTNSKGVLSRVHLPAAEFEDAWNKIFVKQELKDRLLNQAIIEFSMRGKLSNTSIPLHGIILLAGPPGTGKTTLARGLANRVADSFPKATFQFIEVEPHSLVSSALGGSQNAVVELLQGTIAEYAQHGPLIVLLDEVETLAADRRQMSLEANPVDVHRATDAVLSSIDQLASEFPNLLFIATSNYVEAIDSAFKSRADIILHFENPDEQARRMILEDTLKELSELWPKVSKLLNDSKFEKLIELSDGLDGRELRKVILSACTFSKDVAIDPNKLQISDIEKSIKHARGD